MEVVVGKFVVNLSKLKSAGNDQQPHFFTADNSTVP